jgi:hypothetical protein
MLQNSTEQRHDQGMAGHIWDTLLQGHQHCFAIVNKKHAKKHQKEGNKG